MKCNATLRYELLHECGIDDNGEPLDYEQLWSEPIPCFVQTVSDTRLGTYEDGEFRSAKFIVWVETREILYSRLMLTRQGEELGEYRIQSAEAFPRIGRVKITV